MSITTPVTFEEGPAAAPRGAKTKKAPDNWTSPQWRYTLIVLIIVIVLLIPVFVTVVLAFRPQGLFTRAQPRKI